MVDIILEIIRAAFVLVIFVYLLSVGNKQKIRTQKGWRYIIIGFALILFGMLIDITDNFSNLNKYLVIGDTEFQAFLEKVIGYLLGFLFLSIGFWKWMPTVVALKQAQIKLTNSRDLLKDKVKQRTQRLEEEIVERKRVEEKLKRVNSELELQVEKRTHQLKLINQSLTRENSERKQAQRNLKQALNNTKTMLESLPFGVIVVGKDKKIRLANKTTLTLMGVESENEILNKIYHNIICPAEINQCPVLDFGSPVDSSEKILICKDGSRLPIQKTVLPIIYEGEEVLLEAFMDISKLKQVEEALRFAKSEAEAANLAKSEFLSNMSHELRTPLNHIIGFTDLILDKHLGDLTETQEEYLKDVHQSGAHLLSLINDILDLSNVEAGILELDVFQVDVSNLLESSLRMVKEKAMRHSIQLKLDVNAIPETIVADERKLKQILYNILSNAVKFTPDGGEVSVTANGNSSDSVKISISDTGIGINSEDLDRIFAPFEQADKGAGRRFQGSGLGLSLTKKLVELHRGKIWAESKGEGRGATFSFTLPIGDSV